MFAKYHPSTVTARFGSATGPFFSFKAKHQAKAKPQESSNPVYSKYLPVGIQEGGRVD
jgi:hypothetical protein